MVRRHLNRPLRPPDQVFIASDDCTRGDANAAVPRHLLSVPYPAGLLRTATKALTAPSGYRGLRSQPARAPRTRLEPRAQIHACISQGVSRDEFIFLAHAIFLVRSSVASRLGDMQTWHNLRFDGGCPADYSGDTRAGIEMRSFIEKRRPPYLLGADRTSFFPVTSRVVGHAEASEAASSRRILREVPSSTNVQFHPSSRLALSLLPACASHPIQS